MTGSVQRRQASSRKDDASRGRSLKVCIVQPERDLLTETFIRAHAERLEARVKVVHGAVPSIDERPVLSQALAPRALRKGYRMLAGKPWDWEVTAAFLKVFRGFQPAAIIAEYGMSGVRVLEASRIAGIPLVVHFHGADASSRRILADHETKYRLMFETAAAVIAVSRDMSARLLRLGVPESKLYLNPYGVDTEAFSGADPRSASPSFLAVGRFVEKKAPQVTLTAFARLQKRVASARLRFVGGGPLLHACRDLAVALGVGDAVTFLGPQPHEIVRQEMQRARAFVQHSVVAGDGDSEGLPVAVLEAAAAGLPVVSTNHAGIPDIVVEGETGLLGDELDLERMSDSMLRLARDPDLAGRLGQAGRQRIKGLFSIERSMSGLRAILEEVALGEE